MIRATVLVFCLAISGAVLCAPPEPKAAETSTTEAPTTEAPTTPVPTPDPAKRFNHTNHNVYEFLNIHKAPTNQSERVFKPFTFVQAADPQFGLINWLASNKTNQTNWDEERTSLALAVQEWNKLTPKPAFIVINGDLANALPNEEEQEIRKKQLEDVVAELDKLDQTIPLVLMPGNHDLDNSLEKEVVKGDALSKYREQFGEDFFTLYVNNVKFIVLNTEYYKAENKDLEEAKKQVNFLEQQLEDSNSNYTHTVVLQHMPWFINELEDNSTENTWAKVPKDQAKNVLDRLEKANVHYVFTGHFHKNAAGTYKNISMTITSAIGWQSDEETKPGYNIVKVEEDGITSKYHVIEHPKSPKSSASTMTITSTILLISLLIAFFTL